MSSRIGGQGMARILSITFSLLALFSVTGCTGAAVAVIDEKISQMTEMQCTSVNVMFGEDYCKEKREAIKQEQVYCYRTLGGVDCYSQKNPYNTEQSERVRTVSELGSKGAKVEVISQKKERKSIFPWPFVEAKKDDVKADDKLD